MSDEAVRQRRPQGRAKKLCFSILTVIGLLGILEFGARMIVPPPDVLVHQEHEALITVGGLPALNETMEFDPDLFWRLKADLNNFPVAGSNGRHQVEFKVTTNPRHLRTGPIDSRKMRTRIVVLGDSCAFGVGVDDDETWPRRLQQTLADADHDVRVINAGVPGYTAFQGMRSLRKHAATLRPDLVICCFGFNDQDTWASRTDAETADALDRARWWGKLTRHSRLCLGFEQALSGVASREETLAVPGPRLPPVDYVSALYRIKVTCDELNIGLVLLVWPFEAQVAAEDPRLGPYQTLTTRFGEGHGVPVVNLVPEFISAQEHLYVDHIHANAAGCRVAATALAEAIDPILDEGGE